MTIGQIVGKTTTNSFNVKLVAPANKRDYVQVKVRNMDVMASITEIERTSEQTLATCRVIGQITGESSLSPLMEAPSPGAEVHLAKGEFIDKTLGLSKAQNGAFLGYLNGYGKIKVGLDLNRFLKSHTAVLAKTGGGKSFCISTIIEELIEKKVPILIIDPHGEYSSLAEPSKDTAALKEFDLVPRNFKDQVLEFSPDTKINKNAKRLSLNQTNLSATDLIEMLPTQLSPSQTGIIYSALKDAETPSLEAVKDAIEMNDHPGKFTIISTIEYLQKLRLFADDFTPSHELIKVGRASVVNLRGIPPEIQEITVHKLVMDLFEDRKKGKIPPFFLVIEEAHNYIPERSYKKTKCSKILRQIFAEGRKFGIGACIVTQRPSRVEKNALSQVATQIILRVTNPSDIKAIANSSEGVTDDMEDEIKGLEVGVAMVVGAFELPVFVKVRPKLTQHGGESIDILEQIQQEKDTLPLIYREKKEDGTLIPCVLLEYGSHKILVDLTTLRIVKNLNPLLEVDIPKLETASLSEQQKKVFNLARDLNEFKAADLFSQSGLQFSDLHDTLKSLEERKLLVKKGEFYNTMKVNIADFALGDQIKYESFVPKAIKEKQYSLEDVKKLFINPDDIEECFVVV